MKNEKSISLLLPVYNEEKIIDNIITKIIEIIGEMDLTYELLVINDGSTDNSGQILSKRGKEVNLINHKKNKGYGAALKTGIKNAKYNTIIITDADGTYPIEIISTLLKVFDDGNNDMVVGARTGENVHYPFLKKIPKFFITVLANYISGVKIPDINSGLRIFKKDISEKYINYYPDGFSFTTTITMALLCDDYDVEFIPIDYCERVGKSKIRPIKDTVNFFTLLLRISMYFRPFKFFMPLILFFGGCSVYALYRDVFLLNNLTQSSIIFPMGTLLFFSLGLLADLIIRRTK